mmetsp:Transcript_41197/g.64368  ORF Transcript_41197/g.64368 Transcript_41197/m.64368 type:complete len:109 (+) Transcript_41197:200-526(+)
MCTIPSLFSCTWFTIVVLLTKDDKRLAGRGAQAEGADLDTVDDHNLVSRPRNVLAHLEEKSKHLSPRRPTFSLPLPPFRAITGTIYLSNLKPSAEPLSLPADSVSLRG